MVLSHLNRGNRRQVVHDLTRRPANQVAKEEGCLQGGMNFIPPFIFLCRNRPVSSPHDLQYESTRLANEDDTHTPTKEILSFVRNSHPVAVTVNRTIIIDTHLRNVRTGI